MSKEKYIPKTLIANISILYDDGAREQKDIHVIDLGGHIGKKVSSAFIKEISQDIRTIVDDVIGKLPTEKWKCVSRRMRGFTFGNVYDQVYSSGDGIIGISDNNGRRMYFDSVANSILTDQDGRSVVCFRRVFK